ncbi:MAG: hypothetical protein AAGG65_06340 [Pseudomonadota bacterium]
MVDDRTTVKGMVRAVSTRDGWRGDPEKGAAGAAAAGDVAAAVDCPANDSNPDAGTPKAAVSNGRVMPAAKRAPGDVVDENHGGEDTISCTISDGNGGTVTVPVEVGAGGIANIGRFTTRSNHTAGKRGASQLASLAVSPVGKDGSETLKVQFNGLPSGSVVSHPAAIAKKNAELAMLSDRIAALQTELAATERMRAKTARKRQQLIDAGGQQKDIDRLSAKLADLEGRITLKVAQRSVAEIERDIARLESQQLTQTAGAGGTASFHGPGSGYVLHLPHGNGDDCAPSIVPMATDAVQRANRMTRQYRPKT